MGAGIGVLGVKYRTRLNREGNKIRNKKVGGIVEFSSKLDGSEQLKRFGFAQPVKLKCRIYAGKLAF